MTVKNAETLVVVVEALELGAEWAARAAAAEAAIAELRAAAVAVLFPDEVKPVPSDAFAALTYYSGRMSGAELHARSAHSWPALAQLVRSQRADVGAAAASQSVILQQPAGELAAAALARFDVEIAHQLAQDAGELGEAARGLIAADGLSQRLVATVARRREHAAAALAEQERQRLAAEQAREAEVGRAARLGIDTFEAAGEVAREQARLAAAAELARQLEASGLTELRMAGGLYGVSELRQLAANMSVEQLRRFGSALAAAQKAAA